MNNARHAANEKLLKIVVEQLKIPLLHIARQSELAQLGSEFDYRSVNNIADMALKMIDSYLLSVDGTDQVSLQLEPVSLSSVLHSVADNLIPIARQYNCEVELSLGGKFAPIMSERTRLEAAFTMIGHTYIEAQPLTPKKTNNRVILSAYKTSQGISAGVFSPSIDLDNESFQKAFNNFGKGKQLLPSITQSTGVGIFIAQSLLENIAAKLRVAHYHKIDGLAANLISSQQLSFI